MVLDFAFDQLHGSHKGYPNLSQYRARPYTPEWRQFDQHWPYVVPFRPIMYLDEFAIPYRIWSADHAPMHSLYPVAFSWFDFEIDYVSLIPLDTLERIRNQQLHVVFYYHEGDNPAPIRRRLDHLLQSHGVDPAASVLITANTACRAVDRCIYFDDFECWFSTLNKSQESVQSNPNKVYDFTVLSRTNKSWRACVVWDLHRDNILQNSLWSYASDMPMIDDAVDNPLEFGDRWSQVQNWLENGPYTCDGVDRTIHNDHHWINFDLYQRSRFHVVLETHMDADGSGGSFITEKTYKCIKFGQPFVLVGTPGSLAVLRDHGYRVFDHVINNAYDLETDATWRWHMIKHEIIRLLDNMPEKWLQCRSDCDHNAQLFRQRPHHAVNRLMQEITCRK